MHLTYVIVKSNERPHTYWYYLTLINILFCAINKAPTLEYYIKNLINFADEFKFVDWITNVYC